MLGIASHRTRNTHTGGKGGCFPGKGVIFVQNELDPRVAYTVLGIDGAGNVVLRNPWGIDGGSQSSGTAADGIITLSWAEFQQSMLAFWVS